MKKIITILTVLLTVILSSCSNDEIPVEHTVTFKLNPATVVENLYEANPGDLTSIYEKYKLNIDLYIYDESGQLVNKDIQEVKSYTNITTSNINLSNGKYTIVAISHTTSIDDTKYPNFWSFEGFDNLNTLKITDNGKIGGNLKILGLTVEKIDVTDIDNTFKIDIQNAGAVACVAFLNWNRYKDIDKYQLTMNNACNYITTNKNGEVEHSIKSESVNAFIAVQLSYTAEIPLGWGYFFTFPTKNTSLQFYAVTTEAKKIALKNASNEIDFEQGKSYLFTYDVTKEEAKWLDATNDNSSRNTPSEVLQNSACRKPSIVYDYENMSISIK